MHVKHARAAVWHARHLLYTAAAAVLSAVQPCMAELSGMVAPRLLVSMHAWGCTACMHGNASVVDTGQWARPKHITEILRVQSDMWQRRGTRHNTCRRMVGRSHSSSISGRPAG